MANLIRLIEPIRFLFSKTEDRNHEYHHPELGRIVFVRNRRAKKIIARRKEDHIRLTVPFSYSAKRALTVLEQLKPRLQEMKPRPILRFSDQSRFSTFTFEVQIEKSETLQNYYGNLKQGALHIVCPQRSDFDSKETQSAIKTLIEKALRVEAKRIFPDKVARLASEYGFEFKTVNINNSRGRWGSCSSHGSINLSYFCLLLPESLIDFVILHELCHTVQMNHSAEFWALLDQVSGQKAKTLTQELKKYQTDF